MQFQIKLNVSDILEYFLTLIFYKSSMYVGTELFLIVENYH
jgi:hypothetical protein